jgi:hypothetical protein
MSHRKALLFASKKAGISSYSAAEKIDVRYRTNTLRNPLVDKRSSSGPVLDQHRQYLLESLRRWKALSLPERTHIINQKFKCPLHAFEVNSCARCKEAVNIS